MKLIGPFVQDKIPPPPPEHLTNVMIFIKKGKTTMKYWYVLVLGSVFFYSMQAPNRNPD